MANGKADITLVYKEVIAIRDKMADAQESSAKRWEAIAKVIGEHDACLASQEKRIDAQDGEIKDIRTRTNLWGGSNTALAVIAGILGISKS
jgi:hypothetical protein